MPWVFDESNLTYRELNRRADELAQQLRALGVGPDVLVALFLERSLDMVVGMLGVLKADFSSPRSREVLTFRRSRSWRIH